MIPMKPWDVVVTDSNGRRFRSTYKALPQPGQYYVDDYGKIKQVLDHQRFEEEVLVFVPAEGDKR
jgi:hypothetical protein